MSAVARIGFLVGCLCITIVSGPRSLALLVEGVRGPYSEILTGESTARATPDSVLDSDLDSDLDREESVALVR